jgi:hypothetical protein
MIERFQRFLGPSTSTVTIGLAPVKVPMNSQISSIVIWALVPVGTAIFNIRVDGVPLFAGGSRPSITAGGDAFVEIDSLAEDVSLGSVITLDLEVAPIGGVSNVAYQVNFFTALGTSATSTTIGTGSKTFTTQEGLAHNVGSRVRISRTSDPVNKYMEGVVTAYSGTTLTVSVDLSAGAGTHTDWSINIAGVRGADGAAGAQGDPGDPGDPGADGVMASVVAGDGIAVDSSDPANPIVSIDPVQRIEVLEYAISDEATAITTGNAKLTVRMPYAFHVLNVRSSLSTVSSSGLVTVDINEAGSTILSTKLSIDQSEKTSTTAATAAVISDASLADDAEITFDIDAAGTGAKGLKVKLIGYRVV